MERNRNKKAKAFGASSKKSVKLQIERIPPRLLPNPVRQAVRRYINNAAFTSQTFTQSTLYDQFLMVVAVTGNAISYADMVRIRKIKIWLRGVGAYATLQPLAGDPNNVFCSPERTYTVDVASDAFPSTLVVKPRGGVDPLGGWKETNNAGFAQTLMILGTSAAAGNFIMDVHYEYVENIVGSPNGYAKITSTTTLGSMGSVTPFVGLQVAGSNQL